MEPGTLFVVGVPIGNTGDLSPRAVATLRSVDRIACENPEVTRELLAAFGAEGKLVAYRDRTKPTDVGPLIDLQRSGRDIALVSDAGMPVISDPGYRLVRGACDAGLPIRVVPGPSAIVSALAASGFVGVPFAYLGWAPKKWNRRQQFLARARATKGAVVITESPKRITQLLRDLAELLGARDASVSVDITKPTEDHWFGTLPQLAAHSERHGPDGQITMVVAPEKGAPISPDPPDRYGKGVRSADAARLAYPPALALPDPPRRPPTTKRRP